MSAFNFDAPVILSPPHSFRWILYNRNSLKEQLQWLYDTLKESELNSEKVNIIGHIPPNSDSCFKPWLTEYIAIVNRFSHIISGQFTGHSHLDEFSIFYTMDNPSKSLNVAWNGGSGAVGGLNSNYRVYFVDGESYVSSEKDFNACHPRKFAIPKLFMCKKARH